jgi:hypothetical protein
MNVVTFPFRTVTLPFELLVVYVTRLPEIVTLASLGIVTTEPLMVT